MPRLLKLFLAVMFFGLIIISSKQSSHTVFADDYNVNCIIEAGKYTASLMSILGGTTTKIKYLSPVVNLTHPNVQDTINGLAQGAGTYWNKLDGVAGNAYNMAGGNTITGYIAAARSNPNYQKPLMVTEIGWFPHSTNKDIGLLASEINNLKNDSNVSGALIFNVFGTNSDSEFLAQAMSDDEINTACGGSCGKIGANSAVYYTSSESSFYGRARGRGMGFTVEIANNDATNIMAGLNYAWNNGITPIIRVGVGNDGGGFENPSVYAAFLQEIDGQIPAGKTVYAIAGPNEPEGEHWAAPSCGGGSGGGSPHTVTISGIIKTSRVAGNLSNQPINGVTVKDYTGTWWSEAGQADGITGKTGGKLVDDVAFAGPCSVSGRRTTETNDDKRLQCEKDRPNSNADDCNPDREDCAGRYKLTTRFGGNLAVFDNSNYIVFKCANDVKKIVKVDISGSTNIVLNVALDCPTTVVPINPPSQQAYISSSMASCEIGKPKTTSLINKTIEFISNIKLSAKDPFYNGHRYNKSDPPSSDLPPASVTDAHTQVESREVLTAAYDLGSISKVIWSAIGSPLSAVNIPSQDGEPQELPNCKVFKDTNRTIAGDGSNVNSLTKYNAVFALSSPGTYKDLYNGLSDGTDGKARPVCNINGDKNNQCKLQDIPRPWDPDVLATDTACGDLTAGDYPYWYLVSGGDKPVTGTYTTKAVNDSVSKDTARSSEFAAAGDTAGNNPFADRSNTVYPTCVNEECGWKKAEGLASIVGVLDDPYSGVIAGAGDVSKTFVNTGGRGDYTISDTGGLPQLCTCNSIDGNCDQPNNTYNGSTSAENTSKFATVAEFVSQEVVNAGNAIKVYGKTYPQLSLSEIIVKYIKTLFDTFYNSQTGDTNIQFDDHGNPKGACFPGSWEPFGGDGQCAQNDPNCRVDSCVVPNPFNPEDWVSCSSQGYDSNLVCSTNPHNPADAVCSISKYDSTKYSCEGSAEPVMLTNTQGEVHPSADLPIFLRYYAALMPPYEPAVNMGEITTFTHTASKEKALDQGKGLDYGTLGFAGLATMSQYLQRIVGDPTINIRDYTIPDPGTATSQCNAFNCFANYVTDFQTSLKCAASTLTNDIVAGKPLWSVVDEYGPYCDNETHGLPFAYNLFSIYDANVPTAAGRTCSAMPPGPGDVRPGDEGMFCPAASDPKRQPGDEAFDYYRKALVDCPVPSNQMGWTAENSLGKNPQDLADYMQTKGMTYMGYDIASTPREDVISVLTYAKNYNINPWLLVGIWGTESIWNQYGQCKQ